MRNVLLSLFFVVCAANLVSAAPASADQQNSFRALSNIQAPAAMSDKELAAIKGMGGNKFHTSRGGTTWPHEIHSPGQYKK